MKKVWLGLTLLACILGGMGCAKEEIAPVANEPAFSIEEETEVPTEIEEESETPTETM
ncbi:hypothetical protein KKC52_07230 [bacterium]|nr:hypothetical protein [bacterium]